MPTLKTQLREWRLVLAALTGAVVCGVLLGGWSPRPSVAATASAPVVERPAVAPPKWIPALFQPKALAAREQAHARLEAAGMTLDGPSFVQAIATGHQPLIDLFLSAGVDVNAPDAQGRTPLLVAAAQERWVLLEQLLGKGAKPDLADASGVTPLMLAARAKRGREVEALLSRGASVELADKEGRTAASYALASRNLSSFPELLGAEADEDLLAEAWETGDWRFIEPVLSRQTEPLAWDTPARRALTEALTQRDAAKTRLLLGKYAGAPTPEDRAQPLLAWLLRDNRIDDFKFLLECGASPDTALNSPVEKVFVQTISQEPVRSYLNSEPGMTTLMLAAGLSRPEYVRALLDKGAKRGLLTTRYKLPALTFAAETNTPEALQMLIGDAPAPDQMRIEISLASQRATVFREGKSFITTQVSTGRPGFATPSGNFVITDKHLVHKSTIYKADMPFFMRLNCRDFGMHEGVVPGHPASHGCIRLPGEMARRLFKEIPVGTLVSIHE